MKIFLLILATSMTTMLCNATTYTCSNLPFSGAQFSDFGDAYVACANSGDTILLEKSPNFYVNLSSSEWNKSIVVIGIGPNADIPSTNTCIIDRIALSPAVGGNGTGSQFYGIRFFTSLSLLQGVNDIVFENCRMLDGFLQFNGDNQNILVVNSVFGRISGPIRLTEAGSTSPVSASFLNCVFFGPISGYSNPNMTIIIDHCFMVHSWVTNHLIGLKNATISNSIFLNATNLTDGNTTGCTFLNNVVSANEPVPPAGNVGSGNLVGSTPGFVNYSTTENQYSDLQNYALVDNPFNVGVDDATDGTDVGVHGGFTNFNEALEPSIVPIVTSTVIQEIGTEAGGTINVNVKARKPLPN